MSVRARRTLAALVDCVFFVVGVAGAAGFGALIGLRDSAMGLLLMVVVVQLVLGRDVVIAGHSPGNRNRRC